MLSACSSNINVNTNYDYDSLAKQFSLDNINEVSYLKQNELVYNNLVRLDQGFSLYISSKTLLIK